MPKNSKKKQALMANLYLANINKTQSDVNNKVEPIDTLLKANDKCCQTDF